MTDITLHEDCDDARLVTTPNLARTEPSHIHIPRPSQLRQPGAASQQQLLASGGRELSFEDAA